MLWDGMGLWCVVEGLLQAANVADSSASGPSGAGHREFLFGPGGAVAGEPAASKARNAGALSSGVQWGIHDAVICKFANTPSSFTRCQVGRPCPSVLWSRQVVPFALFGGVFSGSPCEVEVDSK